MKELQYLGKTRAELEEILPEGCYRIGEEGEPWVTYTGKGGYINYILALNKAILDSIDSI